MMEVQVTEPKRRCYTCQRDLPLHSFSRNQNTRDGYETYCRVCVKQRRKDRLESGESKLARLARMRNANFLRKYGITAKQVDQAIAERGSCCDICGTQTQMAVDHCHTTGNIRGLLCDACNRMLGSARDRPQVLRNGAAYLELAQARGSIIEPLPRVA